MSDKATILLLHGSKDPSWQAPFMKLKDRVAAQSPGARIATACLQFGSPTLEEVVKVLFAEGFRKFTVVPVFISTLGHVAKDVPLLVDKARKLFPAAQINISQAVGEFPAVQQAMVDGISAIAARQE